MMDPIHVVTLLMAGLAAGYIAGISGLGGGVIFTPILLFHFRAIGVADMSLVPLTVGTSLLCTLVASTASTAYQLKRGAVSRPVAVRVGIAAAIGVVVTSRFVTTQPWFDERAFRLLFAIVLAFSGIRMARRRREKSSERPDATSRLSGPSLTAAGLGAGGLSAAAGVGGGIILVPVYRKLLRLPMHLAIGTSSATIVLLTLVGVASFALTGVDASGGAISAGPSVTTPTSIGYVDVLRAGFLSIPAIVATRWGVGSAHRLDAASLQMGFAVIMVTLAGALVYGAFA